MLCGRVVLDQLQYLYPDFTSADVTFNRNLLHTNTADRIQQTLVPYRRFN